MIDIKATATLGGKKTNRVRIDRRRGRVMDRKPRGAAGDTSPQRAKLRNKSGEGDVWTTVSINVRAEELETIDAHADRLGMSRSRYLSECALLMAGHVPQPLRQIELRKKEWFR